MEKSAVTTSLLLGTKDLAKPADRQRNSNNFGVNGTGDCDSPGSLDGISSTDIQHREAVG